MIIKVANNKVIDENSLFYSEEGQQYPIQEIPVTQDIYEAYKIDIRKVIYQNGVIILNPSYEQEQAQKEAERIAMLNLTAADVERAIYKAKGIDFEDIVSTLESTQPAGLDIKALKIELKANNFYRGNPYIDAVGTILGLTTEQLNRFFDTNDYKYLTTVTLTINPTPADAVVLINGEAQESATVPYGDTVNYSVAKEGYLTHLGSVEMTEDKTIDVELVEPADADSDMDLDSDADTDTDVKTDNEESEVTE